MHMKENCTFYLAGPIIVTNTKYFEIWYVIFDIEFNL